MRDLVHRDVTSGGAISIGRAFDSAMVDQDFSTCWLPARVLVLATYGEPFMVMSPPDDDLSSSDSDLWSEML